MSPTLTTLKQPIAIRPEYVRDRPTKITVNQHNSGVSGGDFTVTTSDADCKYEPRPSKLFSIDGKVASLDQRRSFCDVSGLPIFEMSRHNKLGATWLLYLPGAKSDPIVRFCPRFSMLKDKIDVEITDPINGNMATLEVRGEDIWKSGTMVYYDSALVMKAKITNYSAVWIPGKRPEWEVEVAQGLDLSLASAIVVMLAATMYTSAGTSSSTAAGIGAGAGAGAAAGGD